MHWEPTKRQYSDADDLILGKFVVGMVYFDGIVSKGDINKFKAVCNLPGIKSDLGNYYSPEEAKHRVEFAAKYWIEKSGLKEIK